jgi:hypothetical protein
MRRVGSPQYRRAGGTPCRRAITPRTASARSLSGRNGREMDTIVRSPSAVASATVVTRQRRQPLDLLILKAPNAVNGNNLPSRLVRIE